MNGEPSAQGGPVSEPRRDVVRYRVHGRGLHFTANVEINAELARDPTKELEALRAALLETFPWIEVARVDRLADGATNWAHGWQWALPRSPAVALEASEPSSSHEPRVWPYPHGFPISRRAERGGMDRQSAGREDA